MQVKVTVTALDANTSETIVKTEEAEVFPSTEQAIPVYIAGVPIIYAVDVEYPEEGRRVLIEFQPPQITLEIDGRQVFHTAGDTDLVLDDVVFTYRDRKTKKHVTLAVCELQKLPKAVIANVHVGTVYRWSTEQTTLYGNGNLNEQVLIQFAKSVEPLTAPVEWHVLTAGRYVVGLTGMDGAQAIGYWADNGTEYVDPVRITGDREEALRLAKEHRQECVFRFKSIKQVSYHDTLRKALQYCQTTQGATVFKVRFGRNIRYAVIEAEGILIYP